MAGTEAQWRNMRLMKGADKAALHQLTRVSKSRTLSAGELLLSPKKNNSNIYFVVSGELCVRLNHPDDASIAAIGKGFCCGEISLLDEKPPSAWVSAAEQTELLVLSRSQLWTLIEQSHEISRNLLYILSKRIRGYRNLVVEHTGTANTDALTGLYNRRWLNDRLPKLLKASATGNKPLIVMMVDADHFKRYNDTHGHSAGDEALKRIAQTLIRSVRGDDFVVRYGGEEFTILLPATKKKRALKVAERIRSAVESATMPVAGEQLTVSIGLAIASTDSDRGEDEGYAALMNRADKALYQAKESGRNRVVLAE